MKLYTSDGARYDGMSAEVVTQLRTELGKATEFVDEEAYWAILAAEDDE